MLLVIFFTLTMSFLNLYFLFEIRYCMIIINSESRKRTTFCSKIVKQMRNT